MIFDDKRVKKYAEICMKVYPQYAHHLQSKLNCLRYERQIKKCAELIPKNAKVLDLGCGLGQISIILSILRPDLKIIGIDLKKEPLWKKLKKFKCEFMQGNALALKFKDNSFNAVISFGVMEHTNNEKKFLSEIYRVLKKRGIGLMFNLPNKYSLNEFIASFFEQIHKDRYTKKKIMRLFKEACFKEIRIGIESFVPAQANEISKSLGDFFNRHYLLFDKLDRFLIKTPIKAFAQSYFIYSKKY